MTRQQPPRIATWILKHFGCGPDIDVLLGISPNNICRKAARSGTGVRPSKPFQLGSSGKFAHTKELRKRASDRLGSVDF
jgi:hypothetical protein